MRRRLRATACTVAVGLLLAAGAAELGAQDGASVRPTPHTPRILVAGERPASRANRAAADTVGQALQRRVRIDTLWVLSSREVEPNLAPWPWDAHDTLSLADLRALGRQLRADHVLDVGAAHDAAGVRLVGRLFRVAGDTLPIRTHTATGATVARAADALVDRLMSDADLLRLRRGPPR